MESFGFIDIKSKEDVNKLLEQSREEWLATHNIDEESLDELEKRLKDQGYLK